MTTEALKSGAVTNLDASPMVVNSSGIGGLSRLHAINGSVTATTAKTTGSTYQLVRVRSNAIVKHLDVKLDAAVTTFTADFGCYYSTGSADGTLAANAGSAVNSTSGSQLFGAAVALASQVTFIDLAQNLTAAKLDKELWDACGLSTDPGGFFDIVATTTTTTSGAPIVYTEAQIAAGS